MQRFAYERPGTLREAVGLLVAHGGARPLAGGTDLIIRLRDRSISAGVVVDVKRVPELAPGIRHEGDRLVIGAGTVMTDIAEDATIRTRFAALAEAALVVGSVQIRNRATLAGNICNASPAADTAPALLVYARTWSSPGQRGRARPDRRLVRPLRRHDRWARRELVTAIELPLVDGPVGATHVRGPGGAATTWRRSRSPARCGRGPPSPGLRERRATAVARDGRKRHACRLVRGGRLAVLDGCSRRRTVADVDAGQPGVPPRDAPRARAASDRDRAPTPRRVRRVIADGVPINSSSTSASARSLSNPITRCSTCSARTSA